VRLRQCARLGDGLGGRVWGAAPLLCSALAALPHDALSRFASVLEIGAGTGLCGLAASALGAADVALTDCEATLLAALQENAALNASSGSVRVHLLDWNAPLAEGRASDTAPATVLPPAERFDLVIGSDVLCAPQRPLFPRVLCSLRAIRLR
jgi:predicted nicotinamide N-methyase